MATRPRKKAPAAQVRHPVHRREQQVQGFDYETLQAVKAALADIQKALDSYGNSRPERLRGSIWADLYTRSGAFIGTIYHTLPEQLLSKVGVLDVRMEPPPGGFFRGGREDIPIDLAAVSRGLPTDASAGLSEHLNYLAREGVSKVPRRGGTVHNVNGRG